MPLSMCSRLGLSHHKRRKPRLSLAEIIGPELSGG